MVYRANAKDVAATPVQNHTPDVKRAIEALASMTPETDLGAFKGSALAAAEVLASESQAGPRPKGGQLELTMKGGDVVAAKLDGVVISEANCRQLECIRTLSRDAGETWQHVWLPVMEIETRYGLRVRTNDGLGSSISHLALRWAK